MPNQTEPSQVLECLQPTMTTHQATSPVGRRLDSHTQCGAMVFKIYSTYESWKGNCACWNNDSWNLSPSILIWSVQNWASGCAFLLNILGWFWCSGFGVMDLAQRNWFVEERELLAYLVLVFFCLYIPTSKKQNERNICLSHLLANASRTSILLGR